jgi:adenine-specific DNA-methyltransferase
LEKLEKSGMAFANDEDRDKELGRLAELSDDAFAATEAAYERAIQAKSGCGCAGKSEDKGSTEKQNSASASSVPPMRTAADVRPADVDDKKSSLEDKLRDGFMTAYRERVGTHSGN